MTDAQWAILVGLVLNLIMVSFFGGGAWAKLKGLNEIVRNGLTRKVDQILDEMRAIDRRVTRNETRLDDCQNRGQCKQEIRQ